MDETRILRDQHAYRYEFPQSCLTERPFEDIRASSAPVGSKTRCPVKAPPPSADITEGRRCLRWQKSHSSTEIISRKNGGRPTVWAWLTVERVTKDHNCDIGDLSKGAKADPMAGNWRLRFRSRTGQKLTVSDLAKHAMAVSFL